MKYAAGGARMGNFFLRSFVGAAVVERLKL